MKNVNLTIIATLIILLIGFNIADSITTLLLRNTFEPIYSLSYLGNLITSILQNPFPNPRYVEFSFGGSGPGGLGGRFVVGTWITPSIAMGTTMFIIFIIAFFILAAYLFKRRQL